MPRSLHVSSNLPAIPGSLCLTGPDGAGKTTQAERLVAHLGRAGRAVKVCTIWDLFDREAPGTIPFSSKREIDRFLGGMHADGRGMFLHMAMREALDRALDSRGDSLLLLVGYWPKYNATERVYGADPDLLDHLAQAFPPAELTLYLDLDPEEALARKAVVSAYESGQAGLEGFASFQAAVQAELARLRERFGVPAWQTIDARPNQDAVARAIAEQVDRHMALAAGRPSC